MLLLTFKTLQQNTFTLEFDENKTVKELKTRIQDERGADFPAESLKLIYAGKILEDAEQIKEYKIDAKKFIVVMKTKEKTAAAQQQSSPAKSSESEEAPKQASVASPSTTSPVKKTEEEAPQPKVDEPPATESMASAASAPETSGGGGIMLVREEYESMVKTIMELGYSRRLVEKALRVSYNNPDRACDYLISNTITEDNVNQIESEELGIGGLDNYLNFGEGIQVPNPGAIGSELRNARLQSRSNVDSAQGTNPENEPLAFLRSQPQFHQMRQIIQQNPMFLNTVLQQIGVSNPALLKLISENQVAFVNMINEPINNNNNTNNNRNVNAPAAVTQNPTTAPSSTDPASVVPREERMDVVQEEHSTTNPSSNVPILGISEGNSSARQAQEFGGEASFPLYEGFDLTQNDITVINRIKELGFSEMEVIQAYIACDKNEQRTVDVLLSE